MSALPRKADINEIRLHVPYLAARPQNFQSAPIIRHPEIKAGDIFGRWTSAWVASDFDPPPGINGARSTRGPARARDRAHRIGLKPPAQFRPRDGWHRTSSCFPAASHRHERPALARWKHKQYQYAIRSPCSEGQSEGMRR